VERFVLLREIKFLNSKESETFNPREYLDLISRREVSSNRICTLEHKIQRLTSQLRADLSAVGADQPISSPPAVTLSDDAEVAVVSSVGI
jgi:hypothetical protein